MDNNIIVIGISGATNSGKTTLSKYLVNTLPNCHVICQDNYFFNEGHPNMVWVPEVKHFNWDDLSSLDMKRFTEDVEKWINKQRSILESQKQKKILIVEGFRMLAYKPLAQLFDKKYFITISEAVCKERRSSRVYVPPDVPGYMDKVVWPEYLNHLRELKQETNIEYIDGTEDQDAVKEKILQNILQFLDTKISNI